MKIALLQNEKWLIDNTIKPLSIRICGKLADEDDEFESLIIEKTNEEYSNGKGIYSIISETCEEDLHNLLYKQLIELINNFYSEIHEIQILNEDIIKLKK